MCCNPTTITTTASQKPSGSVFILKQKRRWNKQVYKLTSKSVSTQSRGAHLCPHVRRGLSPDIMALSSLAVGTVCVNTSGHYNFTHHHFYTPSRHNSQPPLCHRKTKCMLVLSEGIPASLAENMHLIPAADITFVKPSGRPSEVTQWHGVVFHFPERHTTPWVRRPPDEFDFPVFH